MSSRIHMDYAQVFALVDAIAKAGSAVEKGREAQRQAPGTYVATGMPYVPDVNAFGNTPGAGDMAVLYAGVKDVGGTAGERLRDVLDEDVTRLQEVIRLFKSRDHEAADRICAAAGGRSSLNVFSAHVHSDGSKAVRGPIWDRVPNPVDDHTADDYVRAGQIDKFREIFDKNPGVVGADLNVEVEGDSRSADAIRAFEANGHRIDAGQLADGGTSASGRRIDYVVTAPGLMPDRPQRVDGGSSDHDGQRVDITVSRW